MFYIKFPKRSLHLTISLTRFNNFSKTDSKIHEKTLAWWGHTLSYWKYMSSISLSINYLHCLIYRIITYCRKHWIKFFKNQLGLLFQFEILNHSHCFACSHLFSFAVTLVFIPYHFLPFVVTCFYSLSLLALFVPLAVIRCYLLLLVVPLVVTVTCCH